MESAQGNCRISVGKCFHYGSRRHKAMFLLWETVASGMRASPLGSIPVIRLDGEA